MKRGKIGISAIGTTLMLVFCFMLYCLPTAAAEAVPATQNYGGIVIDGSFSDWEGVTKYSVDTEGLDYSAFVYDGDMMYFYFEFHENNNRVTWSGPNNNGKFVVINNYGQQMLFQLMPDTNARVAGVEGATFAANTQDWQGENYQYKWEIAIPASNLHDYTYEGKNDILTFGFYGAETIVTDLGNVSADSTETPSQPVTPSVPTDAASGIAIDGSYSDWDYMPVTKIHYATPGTAEYVVDAEGALYYGEELYGYVRTSYTPHLDTRGGDFNWFHVKLNDNPGYVFNPLMVAVDANGNINWQTDVRNLPDGTYEFYMFDIGTPRSIQNISQADTDGNILYGKAYITIGPSTHHMEYYLEADKLAQKFGLSPDEAKVFSVYYEELGDPWVTCAGTSTGPVAGIALCMAATGATLLYKKKRGEDSK